MSERLLSGNNGKLLIDPGRCERLGREEATTMYGEDADNILLKAHVLHEKTRVDVVVATENVILEALRKRMQEMCSSNRTGPLSP